MKWSCINISAAQLWSAYFFMQTSAEKEWAMERGRERENGWNDRGDMLQLLMLATYSTYIISIFSPVVLALSSVYLLSSSISLSATTHSPPCPNYLTSQFCAILILLSIRSYIVRSARIDCLIFQYFSRYTVCVHWANALGRLLDFLKIIVHKRSGIYFIYCTASITDPYEKGKMCKIALANAYCVYCLLFVLQLIICSYFIFAYANERNICIGTHLNVLLMPYIFLSFFFFYWLMYYRTRYFLCIGRKTFFFTNVFNRLYFASELSSFFFLFCIILFGQLFALLRNFTQKHWEQP